MNTTPNGMNAVPAGQTSPEDRVFLKDALQGGMAQVRLGQLALQKSSNPEVKQFAQKMVDDHTRMGDQLKPIAQQIGVKIPDGPSKKDKATITKMEALNGDDFDKIYMKDMVKDHKSDLAAFQSEIDHGSNLAVKGAASQDAPIINQHLQMAEQINGKTNAIASNGGTK
jgi:putative membrane protein